MNKSSKIKKKAKYKKFNLIKVKVTYLRTHGDERTETTGEYQAFNDVLFGGDMNSWIEFDVHDRDHIIGKFKGGGVAISTTQGTTGFNVNNGGAILPLSSKQWFITSAFANRRIRVPIKPKRTSITAESRTPVSVWVDGQNNVIRNVKKIEISKGDEVTIIFNNYSEFKRKRRV
jgi:NAD kinase